MCFPVYIHQFTMLALSPCSSLIPFGPLFLRMHDLLGHRTILWPVGCLLVISRTMFSIPGSKPLFLHVLDGVWQATAWPCPLVFHATRIVSC